MSAVYSIPILRVPPFPSAMNHNIVGCVLDKNSSPDHCFLFPLGGLGNWRNAKGGTGTGLGLRNRLDGAHGQCAPSMSHSRTVEHVFPWAALHRWPGSLPTAHCPGSHNVWLVVGISHPSPPLVSNNPMRLAFCLNYLRASEMG
ncbi:hypothetical protein LZ30DRAFT_721761 [Colletotrichum cereale]|nr:hypothetical protein LZ30DRAFT_721761 [Colletotrichum cereale]